MCCSCSSCAEPSEVESPRRSELALDDAKTDYEKITVAEFESINIKMLEVFDEHLKSDAQHKRRKAGVSIAKIVTQVFKKAQ